MMEKDSLLYLLEFYKKINEKNGNSITNDRIENFKEDVIQNIQSDLEMMSTLIENFKKIDTSKSVEEINYDFSFHDSLARLIGILADLSSEFEDFYDFHGEFIKSLPEGPQDDSELIQ